MISYQTLSSSSWDYFQERSHRVRNVDQDINVLQWSWGSRQTLFKPLEFNISTMLAPLSQTGLS